MSPHKKTHRPQDRHIKSQLVNVRVWLQVVEEEELLSAAPVSHVKLIQSL